MSRIAVRTSIRFVRCGVVGFVVLAISTLSASAETGMSSSDWRVPNLDWSSTRAVSSRGITSADVKSLRVLWRYRFQHATVVDPGRDPEAIRGVVSTPIEAGGTIFVQDSQSSVYAIDRATGSLRWEHRFRAENFGRNGLSYSSGSIYGSTDTTVFSLSAATGRMLWQRRLVNPKEQFVDIAPLIANNFVYVSTVGYPPGGRGALYALDAHTGAIRWKFSTIKGTWKHPAITGGGGAWYTPSVDVHGNVYVGIANPYPPGGTKKYPNGSAFGGDALYTDSLVVLSGATGRLLWYDQVTPRDTRDYDFQLPPILARVTTSAGSRPVVIGGGKAGIVIEWDRSTHQRLWQRNVGRHLNDVGPLPRSPATVCPGYFGGVESPMALADGRVFVPFSNLCAHGSATSYERVGALDPVHGTGGFTALDAADGSVVWARTFPQPDFGCATAAPGVVFTATFDGHLYALSSSTGRTLWDAREPAGINGCPSLSGNMLLVVAGAGTTKLPHPTFELIAYVPR